MAKSTQIYTQKYSWRNPSYFTFSVEGVSEASIIILSSKITVVTSSTKRIPFHNIFFMSLRIQLYFLNILKAGNFTFIFKKSIRNYSLNVKNTVQRTFLSVHFSK